MLLGIDTRQIATLYSKMANSSRIKFEQTDESGFRQRVEEHLEQPNDDVHLTDGSKA